MARLWSSGFELNDVTGKEGFSNNGAGTIQTGTVRSGTYAIKFNPTSAVQGLIYIYRSSGAADEIFVRAYLNISSLPLATTSFINILASLSTSARIKISSTGTLQLFNNTTQVGSDSSALNLNTWYRIEMHYNSKPAGGSQVLEGVVDGTIFATSSIQTLTNTSIDRIQIGINDSTTATIYVDDIAINDSTGSFQNSYAGNGSIVHLRPNRAGDSTQWTPDAGSNYARVNEITPNDATSFVQDVTLNNSDLYTIDNLISVHQSITLVQIGVRFANDIADAVTAFKVQAEKISGGTVSQSAAIIANSITYKTNASASPFNYPLTLYQDPDNINWTQDTINSLQIGVQTSAAGTNKNSVSTLWALVEYIPSSETNRFENQCDYGRVGDGMSRTEAWT